MDGYNLILFLRMLVVHFLMDFVLKGESWKEEIDRKGLKSSRLYIHAAFSAILFYLFSTLFNVLWFPVIVFISRVLFDGIKLSKDKGRQLLFSQLGKIAVLAVCFIVFENKGLSYGVKLFLSPGVSYKFWILALSYILIFWPVGFLIGQLTEQWRGQLKRESLEGLGKAGLWIGRLERLLILTFVLINRFEAIGFLIAAKSIFRFGEITNPEDRKVAEYILIGTLLSVVTAIFMGIVTKWFLSQSVFPIQNF